MLAENTLLKTTCHFLLPLVGFDALTYQKDYDRSLTLVGHHAHRGDSLLVSRRLLSGREAVGPVIPNNQYYRSSVRLYRLLGFQHLTCDSRLHRGEERLYHCSVKIVVTVGC